MIVFWWPIVLYCTTVLSAGAFGFTLGYYHPRPHRKPASDAKSEREPGYREPATNGRARSVEVGVLPPGGPSGPFLLRPGPEVFKATCIYCGSRFGYRLADVASDDTIQCPRCGEQEDHLA